MLAVLSLFCLSVLGQSLHSKPRENCSSVERVMRLNDTIIELSKKPMEVTMSLYAPTVHNYLQCPKASLQCFKEEMMVLDKELALAGMVLLFPKAEEQQLSRLIHNLKLSSVGEYSSVQEAGCRVCELHPETSVHDFLRNLLMVYQNINSACHKH